jgi:hypothetical protein
MIIALIIAAIALQIGQWLYSKKCIDTLKLIAQEWRETAEAYKDELTDYKIRLSMDEQNVSHNQKVSPKEKRNA